MTFTSIDQIAIRDLLKQIENILGIYNESPYDQVDQLRAKICEAQDIVEDTSHFNLVDEESPLDEANSQLVRDFHLYHYHRNPNI